MTTRFTSGDPFGVPSGYDGANVPSGFSLPPVGIEDVDKAMFDFFDSDIKLSVSNGVQGEMQKVPVIFAAGERWAMLKRNKALRDKSGILILPLTAIRRLDIQQDLQTDITGRGINQQTGELVIKRQLSPLDRSYQNLLNKIGINNQDNVTDPNGYFLTDRDSRDNASDADIRDGGLLSPKLGNNVWEIITIPSPQFYSVTYEVTFWTQHIIHMNQIIDKVMASYLPTANGTFRLDTPKGYWFIAKVQDNLFSAADNSENINGQERIIKTKMTVKVSAYQVASNLPGIPSPIRKFVSSPIVSFPSDNDQLTNEFPVATFSGSLDPSFPYSLDGSVSSRDLATKQEFNNSLRITKNPFTGKEQVEYIRSVVRNSKNGETVFYPDNSMNVRIISE
jgi:hypothetical protein